MKNLIAKAREKMLRAVVTVKGIVSDKSGSGMIDLAINIMISVVLGALVLAGLYLLFGSTIQRFLKK